MIGGTRVPKYHQRIETYGTIDELNSYVGMILAQPESLAFQIQLREIQDRLFTIGSSLASDPERSKMKIPDLLDTDIEFLEQEMDKMNEELPELKHFILPGGSMVASFCHLARCVCRRAERLAVQLAEDSFVDAKITIYLNRLSDYFFVLSRKFNATLGASEPIWIPRV